MEFIAGSTSATAPASQILAPVIMLTTIIAINICPAKKINANKMLSSNLFLRVTKIPFANSVILRILKKINYVCDCPSR